MKILIVLTSHDRLGATAEKTGFWLEEFAAPYYAFKDAGAEVMLASPLGGRPPADPRSESAASETEATRRLSVDRVAQDQLAHTLRLADVAVSEYDALFYPGGHGPLWDLAEDRASISLIEKMFAAGKPVGAVCHASGVLRHVRARGGALLVGGRRVTGFSNSEEDAVGLTKVVPFLVENELLSLGATFSKVKDWAVHTVVDGRLITGQNPASSGPTAALLIEALRQPGK